MFRKKRTQPPPPVLGEQFGRPPAPPPAPPPAWPVAERPSTGPGAAQRDEALPPPAFATRPVDRLAPPPAAPPQEIAEPSTGSLGGTPTASYTFEDERTVVVDRAGAWSLELDTGESLRVPAHAFVIGRNPGPTARGLPTLAVPDPGKTISKVHARLELADGVWTVTDLGSTNGVVIGEGGPDERVLGAGESASVAGRFVLGALGMRLRRSEGGPA